MRNTVLLCSFIRNDAINLARAISNIKNNFNVNKNKIFVLEDQDDVERVILTYNVEKSANINFKCAVRDTIQVHRKKPTNTLYTLNALNEIIRQENHDEEDHNYRVDWEQYNDSLILIKNDDLKIIPTRLRSVIDMN